MTIIPLAIINCTVVELLLQVFALVYVSYGEQYCITNAHIFEHQKQCNSTRIGTDDNQCNASPQSQLVNALISACGYNDTHVRDHANPGLISSFFHLFPLCLPTFFKKTPNPKLQTPL
jgi:hypothetical protein